MSLRPFFKYYGAKWRDALKNYPSPAHGVVVEPFAGAAGYSLRHHDRQIILCEVDPILAGVWDYLIHVKPKEILAIPDVDESVDELKIPQEARWLVGFWVNVAVSSPCKKPSKWMRSGNWPGCFWGDRARNTIASQVESIRHWRIYHCSYEACPVAEPATWFIDPPYQRRGKRYRYGPKGINFKQLALWCVTRSGQVIVCENEGADWLPFSFLADVKTSRAGRRSREVCWLNDKVDAA